MNQQNNKESNAVFARKTTRGPSKNGNTHITRLFLNVESVEGIIAGLQDSLTKAQDGVVISIIEGASAKGDYTMIASDGLEDRGYVKPEQQGQAQAPRQQRAYTPPVQQQGAPLAKTGYQPKRPSFNGAK